MSRSSWKGPMVGLIDNYNISLNPATPDSLVKGHSSVLSKNSSSTEKRKAGKASAKAFDFITYSRSSVIIKSWLGLNVGVHNGKVFIPVFIIPAMIGHKLGEFSRTRIKPVHPQPTRVKGVASTKQAQKNAIKK